MVVQIPNIEKKTVRSGFGADLVSGMLDWIWPATLRRVGPPLEVTANLAQSAMGHADGTAPVGIMLP